MTRRATRSIWPPGYYGTDRQTGEYVNTGDLDNELWVLDPDTGKASLANEANALMFAHVKGIYIVADDSLTLEPDRYGFRCGAEHDQRDHDGG